MKLDVLLEDLDARDPGRGVVYDGRVKQMIPTRGRFCGGEFAKECQYPGRVSFAFEALTDPVAFRVRRAARAWLDETRVIETHGQDPDEVQSGLVLHVKQFQNHGAAYPQGREAGQGFGDQEALDRVFLTVEVGAEVESAIGRIHVGFATGKMSGSRRSEGVLILQAV